MNEWLLAMKYLLICLTLTGCAYTPDPATDARIKAMKSMRNPTCREVGSYLYCNEN